MIYIGHNPNTNMLPMFYFLPKNHELFKLVTAEPTGHNNMLAQGEIDMAPISSFAYGQRWREYAILPNLSVSTHGKVGSILLFSKVPLTELNGKTIALTTQSATSVNLLKILLHHYYGVYPWFITRKPVLREMFEEADAALLIGDSAIRTRANEHAYFVYDLGEEWLNKTGCSMTFAVWAYPRKLIGECPSAVISVHHALLRAKEEALKNFDLIIKECKQLVGLDNNFWEDYFSRFSYDLSAPSLEGLKRYFDMCYELRLLDSKPELSIWPMET